MLSQLNRGTADQMKDSRFRCRIGDAADAGANAYDARHIDDAPRTPAGS